MDALSLTPPEVPLPVVTTEPALPVVEAPVVLPVLPVLPTPPETEMLSDAEPPVVVDAVVTFVGESSASEAQPGVMSAAATRMSG